MNLTAITVPALVLTRHFLDALTVVLALPPADRARPLRVVDVGAGAGLPGLALKIALAALAGHRTRLSRQEDALHRPRRRGVGPDGATVLTGRAEDLAREPRHREHYDLALARGLAPLRVLAEYTLPFCAVGGLTVAMKKGDIALKWRKAAARSARSAAAGTAGARAAAT